MPQYFKIGKFVASHGLQGDLILQHSLGKPSALKGLETIYLETGKDNFLPYFIEHTAIRSETETLIKLEEINTKEAARKLTPKNCWLESADFNRFATKGTAITLLGFNLVSNGVDYGEIIEVIEQPHQMLCTILYKGNEALIPVHEQNLEKLDIKSKKVFVNIPDGLLEIYA